MPKIVSDLMLASTKGSTSIYFGHKHHCCKHMTPITLEHLENCDLFTEQENLRTYANRLKQEKFYEWGETD